MIKLFDNTHEKRQKKKWTNVPSLEEVEVVLVQCNLVDNQYQRKPSVYTFKLNEYYAYQLNVEASNLVFLKTNNTKLYVLVMSRTHFRVNPHSIVA